MKSLEETSELEEMEEKHEVDGEDNTSIIGAIQNATSKNYPPEEVRLRKGTEIKEKGNQMYRQGEWRKALKEYHASLMTISVGTLETSPDRDKGQVAELKMSTYANMAACYLKIIQSDEELDGVQKRKLYEKVISTCNNVIVLNGKHVKALLRRAEAKMQTGDIDGSRSDLSNAEKYLSDEKDETLKKSFLRDLRALSKTLALKEKESDIKQQGFYRNMFERMDKENSTPDKAETADE